ncbi:TPA: AAA family ATPase [Klebsiella pneumoniae]
MIKEISLKNFKCFNELYLKQLKTLNIIAGKNNYGKTSILDAIFCFYDVKNPAVLLRKVRISRSFLPKLTR